MFAIYIYIHGASPPPYFKDKAPVTFACAGAVIRRKWKTLVASKRIHAVEMGGEMDLGDDSLRETVLAVRVQIGGLLSRK